MALWTSIAILLRERGILFFHHGAKGSFHKLYIFLTINIILPYVLRKIPNKSMVVRTALHFITSQKWAAIEPNRLKVIKASMAKVLGYSCNSECETQIFYIYLCTYMQALVCMYKINFNMKYTKNKNKVFHLFSREPI